MASLTCQVAIIGAGPYGLSAAAHLRAAQADVRIFGKTMEFWRSGMPQGMVLRSPWQYCHISDPHKEGSIERFAEAGDVQLPPNLRLDQFLKYGEWFQRQLVPDVDGRTVREILKGDRGFLLVLGDGETCAAQRVVIATGLANHKRRPTQFDGLPHALCSHSSEHNGFSRFAGQRVVVIGAGQAALESAVLLREAGAEAEVIVRAPRVYWLGAGSNPTDILRRTLRPYIRRFLKSPQIGTFPLSYILERPSLFSMAPTEVRRTLAGRAQRPGGAAWLLPRANGLPITTGVSVISASHREDLIDLKLDDGSRRSVDHVLLATGFRFDVSNLPFLSADLISAIRSVRGFPVLSRAMESSIPRLHFVGVAAADTFGPLMRFVSGTGYCSRNLVRGVCGQFSPVPALSPQVDAAGVKHCNASSPASL